MGVFALYLVNDENQANVIVDGDIAQLINNVFTVYFYYLAIRVGKFEPDGLAHHELRTPTALTMTQLSVRLPIFCVSRK